jgi:pyruvate/2-oxoglutarate/acetoin dehydrogenase E1 component
LIRCAPLGVAPLQFVRFAVTTASLAVSRLLGRDVPDDANFTLPLGVANVERPGQDVTIVSYGRPLARVVRPAVDALVKDHGIDVELIDIRTLRPLDVNTIVQSVKKTKTNATVTYKLKKTE